MSATFKTYLNTITHDAILWQAMRYWTIAASSTILQDQAIQSIVELVTIIPTESKRDIYIKGISSEVVNYNAKIKTKAKDILRRIKDLEKKKAKERDSNEQSNIYNEIELLIQQHQELELTELPELSASDLKKYVTRSIEEKKKAQKEKQKTMFNSTGDYSLDDDDDDPWNKCPKWMNADDVKLNGFTMVEDSKDGKVKRYGYYSYNPGEKSYEEITNFKITPIFHIVASNPKDSRHLIQVDNGTRNVIMDVESKALVSIETMQVLLSGVGPFTIYGSKTKYLRVGTALREAFRSCIELKVMGWQPYGFFIYVNKVYVPGIGLREYDEWGVLEYQDSNYLIGAASPVFSKLKVTEDDPFENQRKVLFIQSPITLKQWVEKMQRVYLEKGLVGVAYTFLCCFRDIAFEIDHNFPHLYAFGERSSGKSKWAESVNAFFYQNRSAYNLNSGTDFAFFNYAGLGRNMIALFNEFDEKVIREDWFQSIKGWYDGESRQRGSMTHRNKVETQRADNGIFLIGQFLVTKDDNSVVSRSIIEGFNVREDITEADKKAYNDLKNVEAAGITSLITDVIKHRGSVKSNFLNLFNNTLSEWRNAFTLSGSFNQRIMQNWAHLYTIMHLMNELEKLEVEIDEFKRYCFLQASYWCKFIRSSDTLSEFWRTLQFLVETGLVIRNWDYRIESVTHLTIRVSKDETTVKSFTEPTKILFLRFTNVHKLYQTSYKQRTGKEGMTIENLMHYMSNRSYYAGPIKNYKFVKPDGQWKPTNCYAYFYDQLQEDMELDLDTLPFNPKENPTHLQDESKLFTPTNATNDDLPF